MFRLTIRAVFTGNTTAFRLPLLELSSSTFMYLLYRTPAQIPVICNITIVSGLRCSRTSPTTSVIVGR